MFILPNALAVSSTYSTHCFLTLGVGVRPGNRPCVIASGSGPTSAVSNPNCAIKGLVFKKFGCSIYVKENIPHTFLFFNQSWRIRPTIKPREPLPQRYDVAHGNAIDTFWKWRLQTNIFVFVFTAVNPTIIPLISPKSELKRKIIL